MNSEFVLAVHAMVYLYHRKARLSSEELAQNVCTNPVRIRKVMTKIGKAGLADVREGRGAGGYLYPEGREISLREICEALGVCFAEISWRSGDTDKPCLIASGMAGYMDALYGELDSLCKERLSKITVSEVERTLCGKKNREDRL